MITRCKTAKDMSRLAKATSISAHKHAWKRSSIQPKVQTEADVIKYNNYKNFPFKKVAKKH